MFDECLALWKQKVSSETNERSGQSAEVLHDLTQTDGLVYLGPEDISLLFDKLLQMNEDSRRRRVGAKGAALGMQAPEYRLPPGTAAGIIQLCKWEPLPAAQTSPARLRSGDVQEGIFVLFIDTCCRD